MLEFLQGKASERKLRLFSCACCRHIWQLLSDSRFKTAVKTSERYADGEASFSALHRTRQAALIASNEAKVTDAWAERMAGEAATWTTEESAWMAASKTWQSIGEVAEAIGVPWTRMQGAAFLYDIIGNPFQQVSFDLTLLGRNEAISQLAEAIYTERAFHRMPMLGDALAEAGFNDAAILEHLRGPGPHYRGCWALDLILNRS
jgi:hypothetical protein